MSDTPLLNPQNQLPADAVTSYWTRLEGRVQGAQNAAGETRKAELQKAAQEFEAIFIAQLLKVMRETIDESGLMEGGFGKSIYTEMFDQEVALNMARHGTLGIANLLSKNLSAAAEPGGKESGQTPIGESTSKQVAPPQTAPGGQGEAQKSEREITDLQLPVQARISSAFGLRKDPFSHRVRFHKGLDLAAPAGMKVAAALPGKVVSAGFERGYGNTVVIQHDGGIQTRYGHLAAINVKTGDVIAAQGTLGTVGNTGRSTGSHLHFEVIRMGMPVNPILSSSSARLGHESGSPKAGS